MATVALLPVFLLLLLPLLQWCALEKGCLWGIGVQTVSAGAENHPVPKLTWAGWSRQVIWPWPCLSLHQSGYAKLVSLCFLQCCQVRQSKHLTSRKILPSKGHCSMDCDHTDSWTRHSHFSQRVRELWDISKKSFCVLLSKYSWKKPNQTEIFKKERKKKLKSWRRVVT